MANVDDSIENADGGVFVKDDEGHLTGQLFEVYAIERVTSYAPQPTLSDLQTKIKDQWKDFASRASQQSLKWLTKETQRLTPSS